MTSRTSSPSIPRLSTSKAATASNPPSRPPSTAPASSSSSSSSTALPDLATLLNLPLRVSLVASGSVPSRTVTGSLYTYDPSTSFAVLSTPSAPSSSSLDSASSSASSSSSSTPFTTRRNYHLIKTSQISHVVVLAPSPDPSLPPASARLPAGPASTPAAVAHRVANAVSTLEREDARVGKGVSREAQDVFDLLSRTLPVRWSGAEIVVLDEVVVDTDAWTVKGAKGSGERIERVGKVLEGIRARLSNGASTPQSSS
ncbi:hypothetical protein JCM10212_007026 [Sporobolomyces blumeae]